MAKIGRVFSKGFYLGQLGLKLPSFSEFCMKNIVDFLNTLFRDKYEWRFFKKMFSQSPYDQSLCFFTKTYSKTKGRRHFMKVFQRPKVVDY